MKKLTNKFYLLLTLVLLVGVVYIAGVWIKYEIDLKKNTRPVYVNLGYNYRLGDGIVYYNVRILSGADSMSFQVLSGGYAKDNNNVWYQRYNLNGADSVSFEVLPLGYAKDKNSVRYGNFNLSGSDSSSFQLPNLANCDIVLDKNYVWRNGNVILKINGYDIKDVCNDMKPKEGLSYNKGKYFVQYGGKILTGVDLYTFEVLGDSYGYYAKDKNNVRNRDIKLEGIDPMSFEILENDYVKDKNNVWFGSIKLEGVDPNTFEIIGISSYHDTIVYVKDKDSIRVNHLKIEGADLETFEYLYYPYSKDKNSVRYFAGKAEKLEGADPTYFELLGDFYSKDRNNVWYQNIKLEGADANSFKPLFYIDGRAVGIYGDKNSIWRWSKKIADTATFQILENDYVKDKNNVWLGYVELKGADPMSFEILENDYVKDKSNVWLGSEKLEGVDPNTFKILDYGYSRDDNSVYFASDRLDLMNADKFEYLGFYYGKDDDNVRRGRNKLQGADPHTFEVLSDSYAKDSNGIWRGQKKLEGVELEKAKKELGL